MENICKFENNEDFIKMEFEDFEWNTSHTYLNSNHSKELLGTIKDELEDDINTIIKKELHEDLMDNMKSSTQISGSGKNNKIKLEDDTLGKHCSTDNKIVPSEYYKMIEVLENNEKSEVLRHDTSNEAFRNETVSEDLTDITESDNLEDEKSGAIVIESNISEATGWRFKCKECNRLFRRRAYLNSHLRIIHRDKKYLCSVCGSKFAQMSHLKRHYVLHERNKQFQCSLCPSQFADNYKLKRHECAHLGVKPFPCHLCDAKFSEKYKLDDHLTNHNRIYTCKGCNEKFWSYYRLFNHYISIHEKNLSIEDMCDTNFAVEKLSKRITNIKRHPCTLCASVFPYARLLRSHLLLTHGHDTNSFLVKCDECGGKFSESYLKQHKNTHTKRFGCDICGSMFSDKNRLKRHKIFHGDKQFSCDICGAEFYERCKVKRHMKVHIDEQRLYRCDLCDKKFAESSCLKDHLTTHKNLKPFFCEECGASFALKRQLNSHVIKHMPPEVVAKREQVKLNWTLEERTEIAWCYTYAKLKNGDSEPTAHKCVNVMKLRGNIPESKIDSLPKTRFAGLFANIKRGNSRILRPMKEIVAEVKKFLKAEPKSRNIRDRCIAEEIDLEESIEILDDRNPEEIYADFDNSLIINTLKSSSKYNVIQSQNISNFSESLS